MTNNAFMWPEPVPSPQPAEPQTTQHADMPPTPHSEPSTQLSEADRATERVAFEELIAFITKHKDADTRADHASVDDLIAALDN